MTTLKRTPLLFLALLTLAGYLLLLLQFPLIPHFNHLPLLDIRSFVPSLLGGLAYAFLFLVLYGLYLLAYRLVTRQGATLSRLLLLTILLALPLFLVYPINATDIFTYFVRARVATVHGANPLAVPPSAFPQDPYLPFAGQWMDATSPYGPVWLLFASALNLLSRQQLLLALLLFKGLALLAHLASAALIWSLQEGTRQEQRAGLTLLWAWNPALLLMFVVDGHNDALMLFWLLLGWWVMQHRQQPLAGFLIMVLAPLTKLSALLPLPYFFLYAWHHWPTWQARWRFLFGAGAGSLLLTVLAFLPFGSPLVLVARLLRESSEGVGFSPPVFLLFFLRRFFSRSLTLDLLNSLGSIFLILLALLLLWLAWKGRSALRGASDIFAAYFLTALSFRIWYAIWPFPWLLLDSQKRPGRTAAGLTFLLTTQLSVILYGHFRVYLFDESHQTAHLWGVPLVFGLPLLVAFYFRNKHSSDGRQKYK